MADRGSHGMPEPPGAVRSSDARLSEVLRSTFGYDSFRGSQQQAIWAALDGRDCFVLMPTGGGKSMCYMLPALVTGKTTLVISPLIALMQDQVKALREKNVSAAYLSSSQPAAERRAFHEQLSNGKSPLVLYVTPERLAESNFACVLRDLHASSKLGLLAVDEAHCISSWGHEFRPSYRKLQRVRMMLPGLPLMALTATADSKVQADIVDQLSLGPDCLHLISSFNRPNISYSVLFADVMQQQQQQQDEDYDEECEEIKYLLVKDLVSEALLSSKKSSQSSDVSASTALGVDAKQPRSAGCAIVYVRKRTTTSVLADRLRRAGFRAAAYSAELQPGRRNDVLDAWRLKELDVVVATVAFGMGIDRGDVRLVVHYNLPASLAGFYQESGRAGRDGQPARSVVLHSVKDAHVMSFLTGKAKSKGKHESKGKAQDKVDESKEEPPSQIAFQKVHDYVKGTLCRRSTLLAHFGEVCSSDICKGSCDSCTDAASLRVALGALSMIELGRVSRLQHSKGTHRPPYGLDVDSDERGDDKDSDVESGSDDSSGVVHPRSKGRGDDANTEEAAAAESAAAALRKRAADQLGPDASSRQRLGAASDNADADEAYAPPPQLKPGEIDHQLSYLSQMEEMESRYLNKNKSSSGTDMLARFERCKATESARVPVSSPNGVGKPSNAMVVFLHHLLRDNSVLSDGLPDELLSSVAFALAAASVSGRASLQQQKQQNRNAASLARQATSIFNLPGCCQGHTSSNHSSSSEVASISDKLVVAEVRAVCEQWDSMQEHFNVADGVDAKNLSNMQSFAARVSALQQVSVSFELVQTHNLGKDLKRMMKAAKTTLPKYDSGAVVEAVKNVVAAWQKQLKTDANSAAE